MCAYFCAFLRVSGPLQKIRKNAGKGTFWIIITVKVTPNFRYYGGFAPLPALHPSPRVSLSPALLHPLQILLPGLPVEAGVVKEE